MRFPGGLQEADSKKGGAQLWESSRNGSDISQSVVGSRLKVEHFHEVGEGAAGKSAPHNRRSIWTYLTRGQSSKRTWGGIKE